MDGQNLSHMTDEELTIFRRRNIGFVFQQYNLVPMLNVWENIILPVKLDGKKIEKKYVDEIIDTLGIRTKIGKSAKRSIRRTAAESGNCEGFSCKTCHFAR